MAKTVLPNGQIIDEPPQFAGPVEPGLGGVGDMQANIQAPGGVPTNDFWAMIQQYMPQQMGQDLPNFIPQYNTEMFGEFFQQDPFPQELVPPFSIEPGLTGDDDALFGMFLNGPGSFQQATFDPASVDMSQFGAQTREVQPEELVSHQLQSLLDANSPYMQNALNRGRELAQDRGALSSSIFAGASQRAAIEAGVPIASANAQAYIQAASENMNALNQNIMARLQAATNLAVSNSQTSAQVSMANTQASVQQQSALISLKGAQLAADSRERIAETQLNAQFTMQQVQNIQDMIMQSNQINANFGIAGLQAATQFGIAEMDDETRRFISDQANQTQISIANLDATTRLQLQEIGIDADFRMADLTHAQRIEMEELFGQPRFEAAFQQSQAQLQAQIGINAISIYNSIINSMQGQEMDDAARARGYQFAQDAMRSMLSLGDRVGDPSNWPPFDFDDLFDDGDG